MTSIPNRELNHFFLAIILIGVVHMAEQIIFGVEEFHMLVSGISGWWTLFPANYSAEASVVLITIVFTSISLMLYALALGGWPALVVFFLFGVLGAQEAHHWIEAIARGGYDPGLVTSFVYVWVGVLILREVWLALRLRAPVAATRESA
jgi:hypothetical protein